MRQSKKIEIKSKESQRSYLDDVQPPKDWKVRKPCLISKELDDRIQAYIYQKRTQGDIYYTQTDLIEESLDTFLNTEK